MATADPFQTETTNCDGRLSKGDSYEMNHPFLSAPYGHISSFTI